MYQYQPESISKIFEIVKKWVASTPSAIVIHVRFCKPTPLQTTAKTSWNIESWVFIHPESKKNADNAFSCKLRSRDYGLTKFNFQKMSKKWFCKIDLFWVLSLGWVNLKLRMKTPLNVRISLFLISKNLRDRKKVGGKSPLSMHYPRSLCHPTTPSKHG